MISLCERIAQLISELQIDDISISLAANQIKESFSQYQSLFPNDSELSIIETSFNNILNNPINFQTQDQVISFQKDCLDIFNTINIFSKSMIKQTNDDIKSLERKLFKLSFIPTETPHTQILPVYQLHDQFLTITAPRINFKKSHKSGKSTILPFFLVIRSFLEKVTHPFIVITQSSFTIVNEKIRQFSDIFGDMVILTADENEFEKMYEKIPDKPVIALFTPRTLIKVLNRSNELKFDLIKSTRFVLNNLSERSFDNDVLVSLLSQQIKKSSFPLQLLLTSAELDSRVINAFEQLESFEVPDSQRFPISEVTKESATLDDIDNVTCESVSNIIQEMTNDSFPRGNILIVTSSEKRVENVASIVSDEIEKKLGSLKTRVRLLKGIENYLVSRTLFYEHLDDILLHDDYSDQIVYILIIKNEKKNHLNDEFIEICSKPISKHDNIIKIVVSESDSSLEIDNLAALVDCGICFQKQFDSKIGLNKIEEGPISIQTQIERKSCIGKNRPGLYVFIKLSGKQLTENKSTSIELDDITSNILGLRKIGVQFEDISENLPKPGISSDSLNKYMSELSNLGAIDDDKKLTNIGSHFASFSSMSPLLSSSIVKTSLRFSENKAIASIVGVFSYLIFTTNDLYVDPTNESFCRNFNEESDVITLMNTFLEVMSFKSDIKSHFHSSGFHVKNSMKLIEKVEQIASIIYNENKSNLWDDIKEFCLSNDMMSFVQSILLEIEKVMPDWILCRIFEYSTIFNVLNDYLFVYKGEKTPLIKMKRRPGAKGFAAPGSSYILQLNLTSEGEYFGSIIHRDLACEETCHPMIIEAPLSLNNIFIPSLIESYIGKNCENFIPFQESSIFNEGQINNGFICYPQKFLDKTILSFVPIDLNDEKATLAITEASSKIEKIVSFVPRTLLVKDDSIKAISAITSCGSNNFTTKVFFYTDLKPNVYQIDKATIDYMANHIEEMKSIDGNLVVAMTGENFTFYDRKTNKLPSTFPEASSVFGLNEKPFLSHLVVISDKDIPNSRKLSWVDKSIHVIYTNYDHFIHAANNVFKDAIVVDHEYEMIYAMMPNAKIRVNQAVYGRIYQVFNYYSSNCIRDGNLMKDIDFTEFNFSGVFKSGSLKEDVIAFNQLKKSHPDLDVLSIKSQIPREVHDLMYEKSQVNRDLDDVYSRLKNARDRKELRKTKSQLQTNVKRIEKSIHDLTSPILQRFNLTDDEFNKIYKIQSPMNLLEIEDLFVFPSHMEATVEYGNLHRTIDNMNQYKRGLIIDHVPLCDITVNHLTTSSLKSSEFENYVFDVCDRFGGIVRDVSDYQRIDNNRLFCGCIQITIFTCEFTLPLVLELAKVIGPYGGVPLPIPSTIIPSILANRAEVQKSIMNWVQRNGLRLNSYRNVLVGSFSELEKAKKFLNEKENQPKIPFKTYSIPDGIEIIKVFEAISDLNKNFDSKLSCILDIPSRTLFIPQELDETKVQSFIEENFPRTENKSDILYDHFLCCGEHNAASSRAKIPFFNGDGTFSMRTFCVSCAYEMFRLEIERFFNEDRRLDMKTLSENISPIRPIQFFNQTVSDSIFSIPLGQFLTSIVQEPIMRPLVFAWFSALVSQSFRGSPRLDYCPNHPSILVRNSGQLIRCPMIGCQLSLCQQCHRWHKNGECKIVRPSKQGQRTCPNCKRAVTKLDSCNNIGCKCGKFFCFFCGKGPENTREAVFQHMAKDHGDCFADPPDYKKFCLNVDVSDEELEDFYQKCPNMRPPTKRTAGISAVLSLLKKA